MAATQAEADIHLEGVTQALRRHDGGRRPHAVDPARELLRHARPVGLRQDHDAADDRRVRGPDRRAASSSAAPTSPSTRPYKRDVNTVFQSYALFPHLTRREERRVRARAQEGLQGRGRASAPREALELVQLGHLAKRKPGQLSGGQQQRVALARALVNRPRALLLDEPLGALDLRLRKQLQIELKRIQQDIGITFVHVTHDQEEAMSMADTIAVMNGGKIEQAGSATDLYERPRTAFVANFLGVSNLIDAKVDRRRARSTTHDGAAAARARLRAA